MVLALAVHTEPKNDAKITIHLRAIAQLCRAISSQGRIDNRKNWLNSNMSSACLQNMANFGPLTAEIDSGIWGTLANINGFRVLPSLLQRRRSPEANQTLHDVWPSPGLACPLTVLVSHILVALLHGTPAEGVSQTAASYKEWNYGTFAGGTIYIRQGGHHVGHRPTF